MATYVNLNVNQGLISKAKQVQGANRNTLANKQAAKKKEKNAEDGPARKQNRFNARKPAAFGDVSYRIPLSLCDYTRTVTFSTGSPPPNNETATRTEASDVRVVALASGREARADLGGFSIPPEVPQTDNTIFTGSPAEGVTRNTQTREYTRSSIFSKEFWIALPVDSDTSIICYYVRDYHATSTYVSISANIFYWEDQSYNPENNPSIPPDYRIVGQDRVDSSTVSDQEVRLPSQVACFVVNANDVRRIPAPDRFRAQFEVMAGPATFVGGKFGSSSTSKPSSTPPTWSALDAASPTSFSTLLAYGLDDDVVLPRALSSSTPIYSYGLNATRFCLDVDSSWYGNVRFQEAKILAFIQSFSGGELPPAMLASCVLDGTCTIDTRSQDVGPDPSDPIWDNYYRDTSVTRLTPDLFEKIDNAEEISAPGWTGSILGAFFVATWDWGNSGDAESLLLELGFPASDLTP
jgi:hypothetical protein